MDPRARELIQALKLEPHPEGGFYREVWRSQIRVKPADARTDRSALTTIYFLLVKGQVSRWHRVSSDEVWHFYEGEGLELFVADPGFERIEKRLLGPLNATHSPVSTVSAEYWQAAKARGAYALVGCSVGPGFDFSDFSFLRDKPELAEKVRALGGESEALL
ncbi:MAG: cupin domain-containing protein [Spirochaetia bacterium]|nr:cupin domain-containing protein [Spirochaetia bacterium]